MRGWKNRLPRPLLSSSPSLLRSRPMLEDPDAERQLSRRDTMRLGARWFGSRWIFESSQSRPQGPDPPVEIVFCATANNLPDLFFCNAQQTSRPYFCSNRVLIAFGANRICQHRLIPNPKVRRCTLRLAKNSEWQRARGVLRLGDPC